ncbi:MAG: hypothetical protein ISN26_00930, partial [Betaproteobacteria bacterium AqS2]|nr:hypothetical protein [Betaproteobacteria bacterium AqS2]
MIRCLQAAVLLLCAAAAHGQTRGTYLIQNDEITRSSLIIDSQVVQDSGVAVSTDLKFARSVAGFPYTTTVSIATDRVAVGDVVQCRSRGFYSISPALIDAKAEDGRDIPDLYLRNPPDGGPPNNPTGLPGTMRMYLKAGADIPSGDFVFTLNFNGGSRYPQNCSQVSGLSLDFTVTVAAKWRTLTRDRAAAAQIFSATRINDGDVVVPTGIAIQRDSDQCGYTSISLVNSPPAYFQLRKYGADGTADGAAATSFSGVAMGEDIDGEDDDDRHV